jgi:hypothetical protein
VSRYGDVVRAAERAVAALTPTERAATMGGNATRIYALG